MSNPFKTKQFKELRAHWYQRLDESGFEDIEDINSPLELLKCWHSSVFRKRHSIEDFVATQEYYAVATSYFRHRTLTKVQKDIWTLHCDGLPIREIAERLDLSRDKVHRILKGMSSLVKESFK